VRPQPVQPGPGQESVWDFPRPPSIEDSPRHILVRKNEILLAETRSAKRVLETSHAPTYYIPRRDVAMHHLVKSSSQTFCEWKGSAIYFDLNTGRLSVRSVAWTYENPTPGFIEIRGYLAFYPDRLECYLDGERALAQAGGFYGGWITSDVVGPFKGEPGTRNW
jgi:uncharacterized protein (DUF427 family)